MRRFEFVEGSSSKFWEIEINGTEFTTRWGKIGTPGSSGTKSWDSEEKCKKEYDKLVAEKVKKGYVEVSEPGASPAAVETPPKPAPKKKDLPPDEPTETMPASPPKPLPKPVAPPSTKEEDQIFWDDGLRKRAYPRRGGVNTSVSALMKADKAYAKLAAGWEKRKAHCASMLKKHAELKSLPARFAGDGLKEGSVADDAAFLAVMKWEPEYKSGDIIEEAIDYLAATRGLAHTVSAALEAVELFVWGYKDGVEFRVGEDTNQWYARFQAHDPGGLIRVRELLVGCDEDGYRAARAGAEELWPKATKNQKAAITFIFPATRAHGPADVEPEWSKAALAAMKNGQGHTLALGGVADASLLDALTVDGSELYGSKWRGGAQDLAATIVDGCGPACAEFIARARPSWGDSETRRDWANTAAAVGHDATIQALIDTLDQKECQAGLAEAATNQPRRALRLVGQKASVRGKAGEPARTVLGIVVRRFPTIVDEMLPALASEAVAAIKAAREEGGEQLPDAPAELIPACFVTAPWMKKTKSAAPPVVDDVPALELPSTMRWTPGERDEWRAQRGYADWGEKWDEVKGDAWKEAVDKVIKAEHAHKQSGQQGAHAHFFAKLPREHWHKELDGWKIEGGWGHEDWYPAVVANLELLILPSLVRELETDAATVIPCLIPYGVSSLAPRMANAFARMKKCRAAAKTWLLRHPAEATAGLLSTALGKSGAARQDAEGALRMLADNGKRDVILDVAAKSSPQVRAGVEKILDFNALDLLPTKIPKLPSFVDAASMPRPALKEKKGAFTVAATENLLTMLAMSKADEAYAGVDVAREACEPASLARFAWSLFQSWLVAGAPSKEQWAMQALGHLGDDDCARKLAALVREWPGEAAHARAVSGLDVLAQIGTDVALMHLNGIAQKVKFKGLQGKAQEKIEQIAEARGLTKDELADRLVPDLGLDDDGSLLLDFGPRQFRVGFDEQLRPFVKDMQGARLKDMPKPNKSDDAEKAKAAEDRWKALKKDAKTAASLQILRMELAMCGKRRFSDESFMQLFVEHPLLFHVVRRLVWGVYDDNNTLIDTFRVAEDRSFANSDDDAWDLPKGSQIGIPHPIELDNVDKKIAEKWGSVFADYEIVQPFAQIGRPTFFPTDEEKNGVQLKRFEKQKVPTGKVLGLEARGWRRGPPQDAGVVCWMEKHISGFCVELDLEPGLFTGMLSESPEQTLGQTVVRKGRGTGWGTENTIKLGELDPILFSELVRDLQGVVS